jgi:DNA-binding transcriptional MerR regulator
MAVDDATRERVSNEEAEELKPIGEVADLVGLTPRAIRYYEELGLLTPEVRVKGVPRLFNQHDIQRLNEIKRLREIAGFSLAEISELLENEDVRAKLRNRFRNTEDREERVSVLHHATELAKRRLAIIERKLEQLQAVRAAEIEHIELIQSILREQETTERTEGQQHHATED